MATFDPLRLLDIDETASSASEFMEKFGWAPQGDVALITQFTIGTRSFSTIAAYSPFGFLAWRIVEGGVNDIFDGVAPQLQNDVKPYLMDFTTVILDNARVVSCLL
ncbi:MAG: hypothetical protein V4494_06895 [Chlamydiota bacterium]